MIKIEAPEAEILLQDINPLLDGSPYKSGHVTILAAQPSFYPGYRFLDIADFSILPNRRTVLLYKPGSIVILDWTNAPVYELNDKVPVRLDHNNIAEYVRFFFTFVHGPNGPMTIVESIDDIDWKEDPPAAARKTLGKMVEPLHFHGMAQDGTYHLSMRLISRGSLFKSDVYVSPAGQVTLKNQELVVEDIPVLDTVAC